MRYPLWAFFFVLVVPPFTLHAVLVGKARLAPAPVVEQTAEISPQQVRYWSHSVQIR